MLVWPNGTRYVIFAHAHFYCLLTSPHDCHVTGVCLVSQSGQEKKAHKPLRILWIYPKTCLPRLIIIQSCYSDYRIDKLSASSRCLICVSFSIHLILTYYVRKGSWALPTNQRDQKIRSHGEQDVLTHFHFVGAEVVEIAANYNRSALTLS